MLRFQKAALSLKYSETQRPAMLRCSLCDAKYDDQLRKALILTVLL